MTSATLNNREAGMCTCIEPLVSRKIPPQCSAYFSAAVYCRQSPQPPRTSLERQLPNDRATIIVQTPQAASIARVATSGKEPSQSSERRTNRAAAAWSFCVSRKESNPRHSSYMPSKAAAAAAQAAARGTARTTLGQKKSCDLCVSRKRRCDGAIPTCG